jgi:hypothetical protein
LSRRRKHSRGRPSRVVLISRRWDQALASRARRRRRLSSPALRGEREAVVKTIARGMPVVPAEPVVTAACFFVAAGPWVRPAPGIPCALSIFRGTLIPKNPGRSARECGCVSSSLRATCPPKLEERRRKRSNPWCRKRRYGLLRRFAPRNNEARGGVVV